MTEQNLVEIHQKEILSLLENFIILKEYLNLTFTGCLRNFELASMGDLEQFSYLKTTQMYFLLYI